MAASRAGFGRLISRIQTVRCFCSTVSRLEKVTHTGQHMRVVKEQESAQSNIDSSHQNVADSRHVVNKSIEEPHPYNEDYERQLLNDTNISVDDYLNPLFARNTAETDAILKPEVHKTLKETVETGIVTTGEQEGDARDFAEEFTEPIHQQDHEVNQRVIELATSEADKDEVGDVDGATESVAVIHQTLDDPEASNLSFSQDEISHDFEMESLPKHEEKNEDSCLNDKIEKPQEDELDIKSNDDREDAIADVLHANNTPNEVENNQVVDNEQDTSNNDDCGTQNISNDENNTDIKEDSVPCTEVEHVEDDVITVQTDENEFVEQSKKKVEKKPVVPVALKKRVVLTASTESLEEKAAKRKRRWGSTSMKDSTVPISGESIQKLIPDVKIDASVIENEPELDYHEDEEMQTKENERKETVENNEKATPTKRRRTVKLDSAKKVTLGAKDSSDIVVIDTVADETSQPTRSHQTIEVDDDMEEGGERDRPPSPAKNQPSLYLHIENLVRPYTVNQLKQLLRKTGNFSDDQFWINNIKSFCYVMYSSQDEAIQTREALHGMRWPAGTPKTLKVDFAVMEKMWSDTDGSFGEEPKVIIEIDDKENETAEKSRKVDRETRKSLDNDRKKKGAREEKSKTESAQKTEREESPAKLLDDLFRKTKAAPCIYWLPLTEEQIIEKEKAAAEKGHTTENSRSAENPNESRRPPQGRRVSPERRTHSQRGGGRSWR